jgi:glycosyltransferase involved in cell wall biosynthesis
VCVPARNEERNIEAIVRCALANQAVDVEVLVYDDQSTDATPRILESLRREDRVRRGACPPAAARMHALRQRRRAGGERTCGNVKTVKNHADKQRAWREQRSTGRSKS